LDNTPIDKVSYYYDNHNHNSNILRFFAAVDLPLNI
jgi:hypothetical protein